MILRQVTLSNWRALEKFEMTLGDGLNVLQGRNEAGKSSIVEAIDWALYRDISGARLRAEDVRCLVPASAPGARPSVEVELEFPDCRVTVLKLLSEDANRRECRLTVRRVGHADEFYDRTEAQAKLRALFSADGLGPERGSVADGGLLVSHQGESADYLSDGSTAIRSTLGVGNDGQLALTARLERARATCEVMRRREMLQDFELQAIGAARAGTDAARAREALAEAKQQRAHFEQITREIDDLRGQIEEIDLRISEIVPLEIASKKRVEQLGILLVAQGEAEKTLLAAQNAEKEARVALENAKTRAADIARLRQLQDEAALDLEGSEGAVEAAKLALETAKSECDCACDLQDQSGREAEDARHRADAWRHYLAVFETRQAVADEKRALEALETLGAALREAQNARDGAAKAPTFEEIRGWKTAFDTLNRLENEAAQGLQLEIRALSALELGWKADGANWEKSSLSEAEQAAFGALGEGVLKIAGIGALRIRSGARGVEELRAEVAAAQGELNHLLRPWRVEAAALPDAFGVWEERRERFDEVEREWKDAVEALRREEARVGSLNDARGRVTEREAEFSRAKEALVPFEGVLEIGGKKRGEVKLAFDAADSEARQLSTRANRARNDAAVASQKLRSAETEYHHVKARPDALRQAIAGRDGELSRLENDGLNPEARGALLDELNQTLARARLSLGEAHDKRRELGDSVSTWKLEEARRAAAVLSETRDEQEKTLVARRRDLFHACEQDAFAELSRLETVIETAELEVSRHEARLRGLALLDAAIQAERARLSRDLAGPLNEKLAPWLSKLRGKDTQLIFNEAGSCIEAVMTREEESTIALPFAEHSEGLKEQVAFALRLLLSTRVASHLPSKRLPVVLDDPFTQSDSARRGGLGEVLEDAAQSLQILFVTCHDAPPVSSPLNLIRLGDFEDAAPVKPRVKTPKRVEKKAEKVEQKVTLEADPLENGTLALW